MAIARHLSCVFVSVDLGSVKSHNFVMDFAA